MVVSSPEFAPVPNPSTAHAISSRLASNRTHLKAQVMLSPHGDKARRPRLVPAPPPAWTADTTPLAGSEAGEKPAGRRRHQARLRRSRRPSAHTPRRRPVGAGKGACAGAAGTSAGSGQCGLLSGGARRGAAGTVMRDATRREERRLVPAGAGAGQQQASGGGDGRERSNAGEVVFMGERERERQRRAPT